MAVNNNTNLINQICIRSGLQGSELDALRIRLSKLSETELYRELSKSLSGDKKDEMVGLEIQQTRAFPPRGGGQAYVDENGNHVTDLYDGEDLIERTITTKDDAGNTLTTTTQYANNQPEKQIKYVNGNTVSTTTFTYQDATENNIAYVIAETKNTDNSKVITLALEVGADGSIANEDFVDRRTISMDGTETTIYPSDGNLLELQVTPTGKRTLTAYNGVDIDAYDNGNLYRLAQKVEHNGKTYYAEYDGQGNTKTVTQNNESPALIAQKFNVKENALRRLNPLRKNPHGKGKIDPLAYVGEDILVNGQYNADSPVMRNRKSKQENLERFARQEYARRAQGLLSTEIKGQSLNKDYNGNYYLLAKDLLGTKASQAEINAMAKDLQLLNGNNTLKAGTTIRVPGKKASSQNINILSTYGFKPSEATHGFYEKFNKLSENEQQRVLSTIKYLKSQNVTDSSQIKTEIMNTLGINLFDSEKVVHLQGTKSQTPGFNNNRFTSTSAISLETYVTEYLGLDLNSETGRQVYNRLNSLPQETLDTLSANDFAYKGTYAADPKNGRPMKAFAGKSFDEVADALGSLGVGIRTQEEFQTIINSPQYKREQEAIEFRKIAAQNVALVYDQAIAEIRAYQDSQGWFNVGFWREKLGNLIKNDWIDTSFEATIERLEKEKQTEVSRLMSYTNSESGFRREFKASRGVEYSEAKIQKFLDEASKEGNDWSAAYKDAYGSDIADWARSRVSTVATTDGICDIAAMLVGTEAIAGTSAFKGTVAGVSTQLGKVAGTKGTQILTAMAAGGLNLGSWTLLSGTVNNLTKTAPTTSEDWENLGWATLSSAGFGAAGGLLNTTIVDKVVKNVSKAMDKPAAKALNAVEKSFEKGAVKSGTEIMTEYILGETPGFIAKSAGLLTEVAGFTAYEIAVDLCKDFITNDGFNEESMRKKLVELGKDAEEVKNLSGADLVASYLGNTAWGQVKMLGEVKGVANLMMMMRGGKTAQKLAFEENLKSCESLKDVQVRKVELNGHEVYEITYADGNRAVATSVKDLVGNFQFMMQLETISKLAKQQAEAEQQSKAETTETPTYDPNEKAELQQLFKSQGYNLEYQRNYIERILNNEEQTHIISELLKDKNIQKLKLKIEVLETLDSNNLDVFKKLINYKEIMEQDESSRDGDLHMLLAPKQPEIVSRLIDSGVINKTNVTNIWRILVNTSENSLDYVKDFFDNSKDLFISQMMINPEEFGGHIAYVDQNNAALAKELLNTKTLLPEQLFAACKMTGFNLERFDMNQKIELAKQLQTFTPEIKEIFAKHGFSLDNISDILSGNRSAVSIPKEQQSEFLKNVIANNNPQGTKVLSEFDFSQFGKDGVPLKYSRKDFTQNVNEIIKDLTPAEQNIILGHFGLDAKFDGLINNKPFSDNTASEKVRNAAQRVLAEIENFTTKNETTIQDPEAKAILDGLIQGLPEFTSVIGKQQHGTHAYSVDVHMLKVLQSAMKDPLYDTLSDQGKTILKMSALLHDIGKATGVVDNGHFRTSSEYMYSILDKFKLSDDVKQRIIDTIDNHHWFAAYNTGKMSAENAAAQMRHPEDFAIYKLMAKADLSNVNGKFHLSRTGTKNQAEFDAYFDSKMKPIEEALRTIHETAPVLMDTKIVNGEKFPTERVEIDGEETELKVLNFANLSEDESLEQYGFAPGVTRDNATFNIHMTSDLEDTYNLLNSPRRLHQKHPALSSSMVRLNEGSSYSGYGFIIDVDNANIIQASNDNFASGMKKDLSTRYSRLFSPVGRAGYRDALINEIRQRSGVTLTPAEYANLFEEHLADKKYSSQIRNDIQIGDKVIKAEDLRAAIEKSTSHILEEAFANNELVSIDPKLKGLVAKTTTGKLEDCAPEFLAFAKKHNLPIILLPEKGAEIAPAKSSKPQVQQGQPTAQVSDAQIAKVQAQIDAINKPTSWGTRPIREDALKKLLKNFDYQNSENHIKNLKILIDNEFNSLSNIIKNDYFSSEDGLNALNYIFSNFKLRGTGNNISEVEYICKNLSPQEALNIQKRGLKGKSGNTMLNLARLEDAEYERLQTSKYKDKLIYVSENDNINELFLGFDRLNVSSAKDIEAIISKAIEENPNQEAEIIAFYNHLLKDVKGESYVFEDRISDTEFMSIYRKAYEYAKENGLTDARIVITDPNQSDIYNAGNIRDVFGDKKTSQWDVISFDKDGNFLRRSSADTSDRTVSESVVSSTQRQEYFANIINEKYREYLVNSKKEVRDNDGNLLYIEYYEKSPAQTEKFDIYREFPDAEGKRFKIGLAEKTPAGDLVVEKSLQHDNGGKTDYNYIESPDGSRLSYNRITDANGNVIFENRQQFKVISENHFKSVENGVEYDIQYTSKEVIVTSSTGEKVKIKIGKNAENTPGVLSKDLLPLLKQMPGSFYIDIQKYGLKKIGREINDVKEDNAHYNDERGIIAISKEWENALYTFAHEFGHFRDHAKGITNKKELMDIYMKEREAFTLNNPNFEANSMNYFLTSNARTTDSVKGSLSEMVAEVNALLYASNMNPKIELRSQFLQEHFPQTFAKIAELLRTEGNARTKTGSGILYGDEVKPDVSPREYAKSPFDILVDEHISNDEANAILRKFGLAEQDIASIRNEIREPFNSIVESLNILSRLHADMDLSKMSVDEIKENIKGLASETTTLEVIKLFNEKNFKTLSDIFNMTEKESAELIEKLFDDEKKENIEQNFVMAQEISEVTGLSLVEVIKSIDSYDPERIALLTPERLRAQKAIAEALDIEFQLWAAEDIKNPELITPEFLQDIKVLGKKLEHLGISREYGWRDPVETFTVIKDILAKCENTGLDFTWYKGELPQSSLRDLMAQQNDLTKVKAFIDACSPECKKKFYSDVINCASSKEKLTDIEGYTDILNAMAGLKTNIEFHWNKPYYFIPELEKIGATNFKGIAKLLRAFDEAGTFPSFNSFVYHFKLESGNYDDAAKFVTKLKELFGDKKNTYHYGYSAINDYTTYYWKTNINFKRAIERIDSIIKDGLNQNDNALKNIDALITSENPQAVEIFKQLHKYGFTYDSLVRDILVDNKYNVDNIQKVIDVFLEEIVKHNPLLDLPPEYILELTNHYNNNHSNMYLLKHMIDQECFNFKDVAEKIRWSYNFNLHVTPENKEFIKRLLTDKDLNFPKDIACRLGSVVNPENIALAMKLCTDKELKFPTGNIANILNNTNNGNIDLITRLCTDKELDFPIDHLSNIANCAKRDNIPLVTRLCTDKELNFPLDMIPRIAYNTGAGNIDLVTCLCTDKELNFPIDKIAYLVSNLHIEDFDPKYVGQKMKDFMDSGLDDELIKEICGNAKSLSLFNDDVIGILKRLRDDNVYIGDFINILTSGTTPFALSDKIDSLLMLSKLSNEDKSILKKQGFDFDNIINRLMLEINRKYPTISTSKEGIQNFLKHIGNTPGTDEVIQGADFAQFGSKGIPLEYSREEFMANMDKIARQLIENSYDIDISSVQVPELRLTEADYQATQEKIEELKQSHQTEEVEVILGNQKLKGTRFLGTQGGSNTAYFTQIGEKLYYIKYPKASKLGQSIEEVLASRLYRAAGIDSPNMEYVYDSEGKIIGMAGEYVPSMSEIPLSREQFTDGFAVDAWLANWDAPKNDNTQYRENGVIKVDVGGSLRYRARGELKEFNSVVNELTTLIEQNSKFATMTKEELLSSLKHVTEIPKEQIHKIIQDSPLDDISLINTLLRRKEYMTIFAEKLEGLDSKDFKDILQMVNKARELTLNEFSETDNIPQMLGYVRTKTGFEGLLNTQNLDAILTPQQLELANQMRAEIEKFTKDNRIADGVNLPQEVKDFLNSILQGVPEFAAFFSKPQHKTQEYSLDVHILKVLQDALNDPIYNQLGDTDKIVLKFSTLLHDIGKRYLLEGSDTGHAEKSAEYVYSILDRFNLTPEIKDRIISIVDNHHWFKAYNTGTMNAIKVATLCRRPEDFLIYQIMAKADLKNVNETFYQKALGASSPQEADDIFAQKMERIKPFVEELAAKQVVITTSKFTQVPERTTPSGRTLTAREFPKETTKLNGVDTEFSVLNLSTMDENTDMFQFGFNQIPMKDLRLLVHMIQQKINLDVFKTLAQNPMNNSAQSISMISMADKSTYGNLAFGLVLDVDNTNISHAYFANTGSGTKKGFDQFVHQMFETGRHRSFVKDRFLSYMSERGIDLTDSEYATIAKYIMGKQYPETQIRGIKIGDRSFSREDILGAFTFSRDQLIEIKKQKTHGFHNEIVGLNSKIKGVVAKVNSLEECPSWFLEFARDNNYPIILVGN